MENSNNKISGTYYTPSNTIQFMIDYLEKERQDFSYVLEPSAGDGRFLPFLKKYASQVTAIELFQKKVEQMRQLYADDTSIILKENFLDFVVSTPQRYTLIIGNPPYINKKLMCEEDIKKAQGLCRAEGLNDSVMQNMWLAFVVGACRLLQPGGSIFFILPMEFLQVQYAEKLREHLEKKFNTIHIIVFQETLFPNIEQEVCLVYLANKGNVVEHIQYEVYEDCKKNVMIQMNSICRNKPLKKWSNAILGDNDIFLMKNASEKYIHIKDLGEIAPGVVTGGNQYFILSEEDVKAYQCEDYVIPIIQKASYIPADTIEITDSVFKKICEEKKPSYLLNLSQEREIYQLPVMLQRYLNRVGEEKIAGTALRNRYKCGNRTPWYGVPIVKKGQVVFFKRYGNLPRIYFNSANVHTTDAGYHMRLKDGIDGESLVFCFFNSMTLAQCEFHGRYYGGGVCELVPTEFKQISIPYRRIKKNNIIKLKEMFKNHTEMQQIIRFVDEKTICVDYGEEQVKRFEKIHSTLVQRRKRIEVSVNNHEHND